MGPSVYNTYTGYKQTFHQLLEEIEEPKFDIIIET